MIGTLTGRNLGWLPTEFGQSNPNMHHGSIDTIGQVLSFIC
jgi:hypothetical protein